MGFYDGKEEMVRVPALNLNVRVVTNYADNPKATVIFAHGLGEHLEKYDQLTSFLLKQGYTVVRYDQPGHGKSEGERGFLTSSLDLDAVMTTLVNRVAPKHRYLPTFIMGHSMGGLTVLQYLANHPHKVAGAVAVDPFAIYDTPLLGKLPLDMPAHTKIKNATNAGGVNADRRVETRAVNDPDNLSEVTAGIMNALYAGAQTLKGRLGDIVDPLFLMHGEADGVVHYTDTFKVYEGVAGKDKELHVYPEIMHSLLSDPKRQTEIFEEIDRWLKRHCY